MRGSTLQVLLKPVIPEELRMGIGDRVYGCDDCLAACPWNRFAREGGLMRAHLSAESGRIDLRGLLRLGEAAFKAKFAATPLARTRRRGLLRNACVALGNVGSREELGELERVTRDEEPLVAEHAAWAIRRIEERLPA